MINDIAKNLVELKKEFVKVYDGNSQIQEFIPKSKSKLFPIEESHLDLLHEFATTNPIPVKTNIEGATHISLAASSPDASPKPSPTPKKIAIIPTLKRIK